MDSQWRRWRGREEKEVGGWSRGEFKQEVGEVEGCIGGEREAIRGGQMGNGFSNFPTTCRGVEREVRETGRSLFSRAMGLAVQRDCENQRYRGSHLFGERGLAPAGSSLCLP